MVAPSHDFIYTLILHCGIDLQEPSYHSKETFPHARKNRLISRSEFTNENYLKELETHTYIYIENIH